MFTARVGDERLEIGWRRLGAWHWMCIGADIERRPRGASRGKPAPTSVSGQLCLKHWRAAPLVLASISRRTNKGARAYLTGLTGPKQMWERRCGDPTCPAKRRAGGARYLRQIHIQRQALSRPHTISRQANRSPLLPQPCMNRRLNLSIVVTAALRALLPAGCGQPG